MINELYKLSEAMEQAGISADTWHNKYYTLPNVTMKAPCIRITIASGKVVDLSTIDAKLAETLRRYGSNQGFYPGMNIVPLYRITDDAIKKELATITPENLTDDQLRRLKEFCVDSNWDSKFKGKYTVSFEKVTTELKEKGLGYEPLELLIHESDQFLNPEKMHAELEKITFQMLVQRKNISLSLILLFYCKPREEKEDKQKNISVMLETPALVNMGIPVVSGKFVDGMNRALLMAEHKKQVRADGVDAFDMPFTPVDEPMPKVKLAGGITAILRTMFSGQPCQTRYGKIEGGSYPLSVEMRKRLKAALEWIGSAEQKHKTWINTDKGEILFVYPSMLPEADISCVDLWGGNENNDVAFIDMSKQFIERVFGHKENADSLDSELIQVFILHKIDNGRTKITYTRQTNPKDLEECSMQWDAGCKNIPEYSFGKPKTPYPLNVATTLNRFWKANGTLATDKCKPIPKYHGIELLLNPYVSTVADLHMLVNKTCAIGPLAGYLTVQNKMGGQFAEEVKNIIALLGCILYRNGARKDNYMEKLPYLYGQLLKVSDELHLLYCKVVRKESYPTQFAGSAVYQAAIETPVRTLNMLGQRMRPYIVWARTYAVGKNVESGKESWRAKWLLSLYESLAEKLSEKLLEDTRFSDFDKAQFFLGYLAEFPKTEKKTDVNEEQ